mgnify:CR=1 FL=1
MKNQLNNEPQRKTTLKWTMNGELSSIDMARVINSLTASELKKCELTCHRDIREKNFYNLGMWW